MDNFKRVFQVPADHTLSQTSFRSTGGSQYDNGTMRNMTPRGCWLLDTKAG